MKNVGDFFGKFNNKITKQVLNYSNIVESINRHTGLSLGMKDISLQNGVVRIKGTSIIKNEIYIKKSRILKDLEGKLQGLKITDIQ